MRVEIQTPEKTADDALAFGAGIWLPWDHGGARGLLLLLGLLIPWAAAAPAAWAGESRCPEAWRLPQLTIDDIRDPLVPVEDSWQVLWGNTPLSDVQLAQLAQDDLAVERLVEEMKGRGTWVYLGMGTSAAGTAISSVGWLLFGQDVQSQKVTLPMAIGGLLMGLAGVLVVTESVQVPLEPHLAPTPRHRITRPEAQRLLVRVNKRLYSQICDAIGAANPGSSASPAPTQ